MIKSTLERCVCPHLTKLVSFAVYSTRTVCNTRISRPFGILNIFVWWCGVLDPNRFGQPLSRERLLYRPRRIVNLSMKKSTRKGCLCSHFTELASLLNTSLVLYVINVSHDPRASCVCTSGGVYSLTIDLLGERGQDPNRLNESIVKSRRQGVSGITLQTCQFSFLQHSNFL